MWRTNFPNITKLLKTGKVKEGSIEGKSIFIKASNKFPVGYCGDGVAVNTKAARMMCELYGIATPSYRCAAHSSQRTLKRSARSKTICIAEVVESYESLFAVVKHFSHSTEDKEALNTSMELLDMTPKHLLSWCGKRMAHFLDACTQISQNHCI